MSAKEQRALTQQNHSIMYMQQQSSQRMRQEFGQLKHSNLIVLGLLSEFLDSQAKAEQERRELQAQQVILPQIAFPGISEDILERFLYEPNLVSTDSEKVLKSRHIPGYDLDEDLVSAIKSHPRFLSWLTLNESSLIFLDTRSENPACRLEMPIVSAEVYRDVLEFSNTDPCTKDEPTNIICLAFFCSQHEDFAEDENGSPSELAMSLLLQLLDQHRDFDPCSLEPIFDQLDPRDTESICSALEALVSQLPANIIMIVMVDDLSPFAQPLERKIGTIRVIEQLRGVYRRGQYSATVKFLFANSMETEFDEVFMRDEILRIWAPAFSCYS